MTFIKICGITRPVDADKAVEFGADALGFNFYAKSPRWIPPEQAWPIMQSLPKNVRPVALYVNKRWSDVTSLVERLGVRLVQIHADVHEPCPNKALEWIPAFPVKDQASLTIIENFLARCREMEYHPAAILVDAHVSGLYGGTGRTPPWEMLADFQCDVPLVLAGGLTPENVVKAIRTVRPWAVDVASGVEESPGIKDVSKMKRFIDAVRSVS